MNSDWQGVRVAITGHTGFKGAWLAFMLHRLGAKVTGYALAPETTPNLYDALALADLIDSRIGDIRDDETFDSFIRVARPQVLFHFAAQSLVRRGYAFPIETFDVNVLGTVRCLEVAFRRDVPVVVVATSDKCYRNDGSSARPFVENDALGGSDPYSASKAAAEIVIESYRKSYFKPSGLCLASVRAGNVIGGGDWSEDRLMSDLVRAVFEDKPLRIRFPNSVRPWQHVIDALRGYISIASFAKLGMPVDEPWNLGPEDLDDVTVQDVIEMFARAAGRSVVPEPGIFNDKSEAAALRLDAGKAAAKLSWRPLLRVTDSVALAAEWYRDFYAGSDMRRVTERQLESIENHKR